MLIPKKIANSKKTLFTTGLLIIVGVILYIVYDHYYADDLRNKRLSRFVSQNADIFETPEIDTNLHTNIFSSSKYIDLRQHGVLPVSYQRKGKADPFRQIINLPTTPAPVDSDSINTPL